MQCLGKMRSHGEGDVGRSPALAIGGGRISIAYMDYTTGSPYGLKVIE